jgi:hypothetical protein
MTINVKSGSINIFRIKVAKFIEANLKYPYISQQEAMQILEIEQLTQTKSTDKILYLQIQYTSRETVFFTGIYQRGRSEGGKGSRPDGKSKARPRLEDKSERPH